jgi:hypothetical protein
MDCGDLDRALAGVPVPQPDKRQARKGPAIKGSDAGPVKHLLPRALGAGTRSGREAGDE